MDSLSAPVVGGRTVRRMVGVVLVTLLLAGCSEPAPDLDYGPDPAPAVVEPIRPAPTAVSPDQEQESAAEALDEVFDADTAAWFVVTCNALHEYDELVDSLALLTGEVADDPVTTRDIALGGLQPITENFLRLSVDLRDLEPPELPGGEDVHSGTMEAFDGLESALLAAVDDLERADTSTVDTVLEAMFIVGESLQEAVGLSNPRAEVRRLGAPSPEQLAVLSTVVGCRTQHFD